jgi:hypothetical protein
MSAEGKAAGKAAEHVIAKAVEGAGVREADALVSRIEKAGVQSVRDAESLAVKDALACGENRTPQQILKDMEHEQASRLTAPQREQISQTLQTAGKNEKVLTPQLRDISSASGMRMEGLGFAVKSQDSLERKIGGKLPTEALDAGAHQRIFARQLNKANDIVRYTMVAPEGGYATATNRAMRAMEDQGFVKEVVKDNWVGSTGYRGVNTTWFDPATGQRFEMQFHTPESLAAKEVTHPIYDFSRVADPQMAPRFNELQNKVFDMVPLPEGTTRRGDPQWLGAGGTS